MIFRDFLLFWIYFKQIKSALFSFFYTLLPSKLSQIILVNSYSDYF